MLNRLSKKYILVLTALMVVFGAAMAYAANGQVSSMSGQVVSVVATGTKVTEGTVLVRVKTLAGATPAARANCSGTVVSIVSVGSTVSAGQTVAQVQP